VRLLCRTGAALVPFGTESSEVSSSSSESREINFRRFAVELTLVNLLLGRGFYRYSYVRLAGTYSSTLLSSEATGLAS